MNVYALFVRALYVQGLSVPNVLVSIMLLVLFDSLKLENGNVVLRQVSIQR